MFDGFSDSSLSTWSFWLQVLGVAGALGLIVSLLGMHFVSTEMAARTEKELAVAGRSISLSSVHGTTALLPLEKVPISLARPPQKLGSREITEDQTTTFIAELDHAPKHAVDVIISDQDDAEVRAYADQIRVMLILAGYDGGPEVKINSNPLAVTGLLIIVQDPAHAPSFAGALQNGFKTIGINARGARDENFRADQVAVFVGRKK